MRGPDRHFIELTSGRVIHIHLYQTGARLWSYEAAITTLSVPRPSDRSNKVDVDHCAADAVDRLPTATYAVAVLAPKTGGAMLQSPCCLLGCPSLLDLPINLNFQT